MTVRRGSTKRLAFGQEAVLAKMLDVLSHGQRGYRYVDTLVSEDRTHIETRVKPWLWPLVLSTPVTIDLVAQDYDSCDCTISTSSQRFIFDDVFKFYDRYIADLFCSVGLLGSATKQVDGKECL
jgi:hypothetical protein